MLLFAYAGNMDVHKFSETVPSAKKIGTAHLPGYSFTFNKTADDESSKANIIPSADPADAVWGVLIEFDEQEKENFYNPDTWSSDLKLEPVNCIDGDGELHQAIAFFAQPHAVNPHLLPYDWYHKKLIQLAEDVALPAEYITKISIMPFKVDPDEDRREKRLRKLKR
jgi:gamma-glutamylcyclotransferase